MTLFSSLTNRIFLASALLAVATTGVAVYVVGARATHEAETELARGLADAATQVAQQQRALAARYVVFARLLADLPKLKSAVETQDPPTVAADRGRLPATGRRRPAARHRTQRHRAGARRRPSAAIRRPRSLASALAGHEVLEFRPHPRGILQVVTVPISDRPRRPRRARHAQPRRPARRAAGRSVQARDAERSRVRARTTRCGRRRCRAPAWTSLLLAGRQERRATSIRVADAEYVGLALPPLPSEAGMPAASGPVAATFVLQSRTERLRFLRTVDTALVIAAIAAVLLATVLSYAVARTVTRPLGAITNTMREVAATGDLTRKITLRGPAIWQDEDARLLATTFNTPHRLDRALPARGRAEGTAALARPAVHGDRARSAQPADDHQGGAALAAPGRLAAGDQRGRRRHRRGGRPPESHRQRRARLRAAAGVLARARGPRARLPRCRGCRVGRKRRARRGHGAAVGPRARRRPMRERLQDRAGQPARERAAGGAGARDRRRREPPVVQLAPMWSCGSSGTGPDRVLVQVRDRGAGIRTKDLAQIFEPYFTTRRSGTGLGLPIARNIVEGLGGTSGHTHGRGRHDDRYRSARTPARSRRHMTATGSILLVDDEEKILKTLGRALRAEGHRVVERSNAREARRLITDEAFDVLIVDNLMPDHDRARADPRRRHVGARERPAADHHDDGARDRRGRHRGDEARSARLPAEALRSRSPARHHQPGHRSPAPAHRAPLPAQRARRGVQPLRHRRPQPDDAGGDSPGRARGRDQEHGAHHGRDRDRQGARGAGDSRSQRRAAHAAHQGELRGHPGNAAGIGAVRPRARRVHRGDVEQEGPFRAGQRRQHLPGRDRDAPGPPAGQAPARAAGARVRAARAPNGPSTWTCA